MTAHSTSLHTRANLLETVGNSGRAAWAMGNGRALPEEVWRSVDGYEDLYEVSNLGNVRSLRLSRDGGALRGCTLNGYRFIKLCRDGKKRHAAVHRLVCRAFHGPGPDGHEVGHLDGTRSNNCADNLMWITRSQNMLHAKAHGTLYVPCAPCVRRDADTGDLPGTKYSAALRAQIRSMSDAGVSNRQISRTTGVSETHVRNINGVSPLPEPVPVSAHSGDGQPRAALRPGAVFEAATAIITATHGPRPAIKRVAWSARQHGSAEATRIATGMTAELDSMTAAFAWDRRVTALTRAIVAEMRVLS